jgi:L-rhamnonate dehydratase
MTAPAKLMGTKRDRIRAYISVLFPDTAVEAANVATALAERGFSTIKFGWGWFGHSREWDCGVMAAARAAVGDKIDLMIDAGRLSSVEKAIGRAPELFERFNILWLEEPLSEDDLDGYTQLTRVLRQQIPAARVATGETEERESDFAGLLDHGVRVIQPDVGRAGGLTVCRRLSALANRRGAWCVPHSFGTGVNLAASAKWMGSAEDAPIYGIPGHPITFADRSRPWNPRDD